VETVATINMSTGRINESAQARFEALLEQHQKILFKVAGSYCRNAEDRRDLVQEMMAQLWRSFSKYDPQRAFSTWMYRIALNVAISFARRASYRRMEALEAEPGAAEAEEEDERVRKLRSFMEQMDVMNRALLLLYMEEHSYREIAEVLGISESNVGTKISRLKQRIREEL
jgi:RNA polymerase sigma-70 factor (ECF subfamily)